MKHLHYFLILLSLGYKAQVNKIWERELNFPTELIIENASVAINGVKLIDNSLYLICTQNYFNNNVYNYNNLLLVYNTDNNEYSVKRVSNQLPSNCFISQGGLKMTLGKSNNKIYSYPNNNFNLCITDELLDNSLNNDIVPSLYEIINDSIQIYDTVLNSIPNHGILIKDNIIAYFSKNTNSYILNIIFNNNKYSVVFNIDNLFYGTNSGSSYFQFLYEFINDDNNLYMVLSQNSGDRYHYSIYKHTLLSNSIDLYYSTFDNERDCYSLSLSKIGNNNFYPNYRIKRNENTTESVYLNSIKFNGNDVNSRNLFTIKGSVLDFVLPVQKSTNNTSPVSSFILKSTIGEKIILYTLNENNELVNIDSSLTNYRNSNWLYAYASNNNNIIVTTYRFQNGRNRRFIDIYNSDLSAKYTYLDSSYTDLGSSSYEKSFIHCEFNYENDSLFMYALITISKNDSFPFYSNVIKLVKYYINDEIVNQIPKLLNPYPFHIFPNPGNQSFTLQLKEFKGASQITVSNQLGQIIYQTQQKEPNITIQANDWPDGIYFVKVKQNNTIQTLKWIKQ